MKGLLTDRLQRLVRGAPSDRDEHAPRAERFYICKTARIKLESGASFEVVVRNISAGGASIEFRNLVLPDKVLIVEPGLRLHRWAQVIWRKPGCAGLQFIADEIHRPPPPANDATARPALVRKPIEK